MTLEELSVLPINSRVVFQRGNAHNTMLGVIITRPANIAYILWNDGLCTDLLPRNSDIFKFVELWDWGEEHRSKMIRGGGA
jgi:hypothetical protein